MRLFDIISNQLFFQIIKNISRLEKNCEVPTSINSKIVRLKDLSDFVEIDDIPEE
jgi:hypothetical protein